MRNTLALVGLVVVGFVGVGWYLDWYKATTKKEIDGTRSIDIDLNTPKISADLKKGKEAVKDMLNKDKNSSGTPFTTTVSPTTFTPPPGTPFFGTPSSGSDTFVLPALEFPAPPTGSLPKPPVLPQ